jgi:CDP-glucose 4,6-dehydratase
MPFADIFAGKKVLVTGHTGFKGSWLCEWLLMLGADVSGLALPPPTQPSLFDQLALSSRMNHCILDIRDLAKVCSVIESVRPEIIFHLAAQPLVRRSYTHPVETYGTNIMGTVHLLEAARIAGHPCTIVAVTTDKCYENQEWLQSYREDDPMGGHDPYSSSKGAAELVVAAYRRSYFSSATSPVRLASARAGNVIGGGDWAEDRIVPDCIRALMRNEPVVVRNKTATRPWQHVLEPLSGYLWLAASLAAQGDRRKVLESAFNFGPLLASNCTVAHVVEEALKYSKGSWIDRSDPLAPHEAGRLNLATDKAFHLLGWRAAWDFQETVRNTIGWYLECQSDPSLAGPKTRDQIADYTASALRLGQTWARKDMFT